MNLHGKIVRITGKFSGGGIHLYRANKRAIHILFARKKIALGMPLFLRENGFLHVIGILDRRAAWSPFSSGIVKSVILC